MSYPNIRTDLKNVIANKIRQVPDIKNVYTYFPRIQYQTPGVIVALPQVEEVRATASAVNGKKHIKFTAQLSIQHIDNTPDGSGQLLFDSVLDKIDDVLRQDVTLGGALPGGGTIIASTVQFIRTKVAPPYLSDGNVLTLLALKQFDVVVQITG